jgi:DNA sulfur modification protein DndC
MLKIEPMMKALLSLRQQYGQKFLMITGVRLGESAVRDARIALSCSRDGAECGQGWFQHTTPESVADTLAPLLHWRVCHVWDWLTFDAPAKGFPTGSVADAYGGDEAVEINARTGCVGCNLASKDTALETILKSPNWKHLEPLRKLKPLYEELRHPKHRLRKDGSETRKDGTLVSNPMRMGPYTLDARRWGLEQVLSIQREINDPRVVLINDDELKRIQELIGANTWPDGWSGNEPCASELLPEVYRDGTVQHNLFGG